MSSRSGSRRRRLLLAAAGAAAAALLLSELLLRLVAPPPPPGAGEHAAPKARLYGWAMHPRARHAVVHPDTGDVSWFTTNSQGWKDVEHAFEPPPGRVRVVVVGDSNSVGVVPLEALWTRQLERVLHERGRPDVEVITLALSGWGTDQALEALRREGMRYRPRVVVYQFCGNDVQDNVLPRPDTHARDPRWWRPYRYRLAPADGEPPRLERLAVPTPTPPSPSLARLRAVARRSALLDLARRARRRLAERPPGSDYEALRRDHWWEQYPTDPAAPDFAWSAGEEHGETRRAWALLEGLLAEMKRVAEAGGARLVVFSEEGEEGKRRWNLRWKRFLADAGGDHVLVAGRRVPLDFARPLRNLALACERAGVELVRPRRVYTRFVHDPHADAEGNRAMAEDVAAWLLESGLLGPPPAPP